MAALTSKEEKRLEELQKEGQKDIGEDSPSNITTPDLLLLLRHDPEVKKLILKIVDDERKGLKQNMPDSTATEPDDEPEQEAEATEQSAKAIPERHEMMGQAYTTERIVHKDTPVDTLRSDLAAQLALLAAIEADAELCRLWLGELSDNEGEKLLKLVANAANWDRVEELWDLLALRCKNSKQAASESMQKLLQGCVALHNLTWQGRAASLPSVTVGEAYDFKLHDRGTPNGETIAALWLPGLKNAAGNLRKKPLVSTV